jgi:hypothetical protein
VAALDRIGWPPSVGITGRFASESAAKFVGTEGKRVITSINDNEFHSMNPTTSTGTKAESVWKRAK